MAAPSYHDYPYLEPATLSQPDYGYLGREEYCEQLSKSAVIGRYDAAGQFQIDQGLMAGYGYEIPVIAEALACKPQDARYRRYKVAAIDKATNQVHLEWLLAKRLGKNTISFVQFDQLRKILGVQPLLVDMQGPCVEVIWPETLKAALLSLDILNQQVDMVPPAVLHANKGLYQPHQSFLRISGF
ncbi:hypothetical protein MIB92_13720 [Aestuariirhabdus sp. Z084]|uniref:hypothetical protein n=1 Tax=Aestuariirhabdus haliotis TaxID=2918751 RepID=UPI00201B3944|nr:hypothetical protein [Aestuariirhabdus haliotis]MCL6416713.1 hypothetical protein [Aestuariirhabdus haliotis]MCL6420698.1 hypothetical protein [Aestuariirhabdus haliotis]